MVVLAVTHNFAPNTLAEADQVDQNFTDIVTWANTNAIQKDASLAFTNIPSGPALDPSTDNQFARKRYVDRIMQHGSAALNYSSSNRDSGAVVFPTAFIAAPTVQLTVRASSSFDLLPNLTAAPTTTGFNWTVFQKDGNTFTGTATLYWSAFGRY